MSEREYTALKCDNCGSLEDSRNWGTSTWTNSAHTTFLCAACTADYRLVEDKICVRKWVAKNNPPGAPDP